MLSCGLPRRRWFEVCGLQAIGLSLTRMLRAEVSGRSGSPTSRSQAPKSCIFVFLYGGPSQLDTWDLKPNAPADIRGDFNGIETSVPGIRICEHLPRLARLVDQYSIVRSLHHNNLNHSPASGWVLTGSDPRTAGDPKKRPSANDPPALGSIAAYLAPSREGMPSYVHLPAHLYFDTGLYFLGQAAGWLGPKFDPLLIEQDPNSPKFRLEEFAARPDVPMGRLEERRRLLTSLDKAPGTFRGGTTVGEYQRHALDLLTKNSGRTAFDIQEESPRVRDRYGRSMLGQSCLVARRLVEAGVRLITVADCSPGGYQQWDTHTANFATLKAKLLPRFDQAASALLEDLHERRLLDSTVVYFGGEFGRTPRIGERSAGGAEADGRDHWSACFSSLVAGGDFQSGMTFGASDRFAAYPVDSPLTPDDMGATILTAMGLDPTVLVKTIDGRPVPVSHGTVARGLLR